MGRRALRLPAAAGTATCWMEPGDVWSLKMQMAITTLWTLDHRRLAAFRIAGLDSVPFRWATDEEVANQTWKMTTKTNGTSVKLKLGNGQSMTIQ